MLSCFSLYVQLFSYLESTHRVFATHSTRHCLSCATTSLHLISKYAAMHFLCHHLTSSPLISLLNPPHPNAFLVPPPHFISSHISSQSSTPQCLSCATTSLHLLSYLFSILHTPMPFLCHHLTSSPLISLLNPPHPNAFLVPPPHFISSHISSQSSTPQCLSCATTSLHLLSYLFSIIHTPMPFLCHHFTSSPLISLPNHPHPNRPYVNANVFPLLFFEYELFPST